MPKITPAYLRPFETSSPNSPVISYPSTNYHEGMKSSHKAALAVGIAIVVLACILLLTGAINPLATHPSPTPTTPVSSPTISSITPAPIIAVSPTPSSSYVEVNYETAGWFFSSISEHQGYNYTYLILNVTITNHGYSQVNVFGDLGFSIIVNNDEYLPANVYPHFPYYNSSGEYYVDYPFVGITRDSLNLGSSLPNPAKLLDTGSINGTLVFRFGDTTVYPQQPQILYETFTLKYSVAYGKDGSPLFGGPYATVEIEKK